MSETSIVIILALGIMLGLNSRDSALRISALLTANQHLRALLARAQQENAILRAHLAAAQGQRPEGRSPEQDAESKLWREAWALEVLGLEERALTPEAVRRARRDAIKVHHPDAGGRRERFEAVEKAVSILEARLRFAERPKRRM